VLGRQRAWLFAHGADPAEAAVQAGFAALLERRGAANRWPTSPAARISMVCP